MVTSQPGAQLKRIDFGLAIHLNKGENATEVCGTTSYMAPEVLNGNYSMECDVRQPNCLLAQGACGKRLR